MRIDLLRKKDKETSLKEKVVFITGASSGIGKETACRFARAGASLVLTYFRGKARGEETQERCRELGAKDTLLLYLDVSQDKGIAEAVKRIREKYARVDILINNAGTGAFKQFKNHTADDIEHQVRVNLEGLMKVTLAFLPLVKETIINIGSTLAKHASANYSVYCGTKFGVRGFTQALAQEMPELNICCVNPDYTATALTNYGGRPAGEVADIIFKAAAGEIACAGGGDVDVSELLS